LFLPKTNRKIIPRWRDFWTTAALGQLSPAEISVDSASLPRADQLEAREAWLLRPTLWHALDLIGSAFVVSDLTDPEVLSAAKYLESRIKDCPPPAQRLIHKVLYPTSELGIVAESLNSSEERVRTEIHKKRRRLSTEPRNSILWTDLACLYTSLGEVEKAQHAIDMSCYLAPDNRFVVRSSARFLVHIGEYEKALRLLRSTELHQSDPWVVAAEIGISTFSNKDSRLFKLGRRMVESHTLSDFSKSELASAMATVELNEGNRKAARKLFKESLAVPTENSFAQAEWASAEVGELNLTMNQGDIPRNYEARALHGYRLGEWETAVRNTQNWLNDQPFSSRPAGVLSNLYSSILERYQDALAVVKFGLNSNPGDRMLTNNLAFVLINLDRLDEAEAVLKRTNAREIDDTATITLTATEGLLLFRTGLPEVGRSMYLDAIDLAMRKGNRHYAALASIFMAIEEIRADTETKSQSFRSAAAHATKSDEPDVRHLYYRLLTMAKVAHLSLDEHDREAK
jgi:tetratricopeptide (TPR) repeat protein